jgi:hypothetical protein
MNTQQKPDEFFGYVISDSFKIFDPETKELLTEDEKNDI